MWQTEIVIALIHRQLLAQARLLFTQRGDASPHRRHMLTDAEVDALNERRVDLPAVGGQPLLDRLKRPEHRAVANTDHTAAPILFDHLDFLPFVNPKEEVFTSP